MKYFWIHAFVSPSNQIFSTVMGENICINMADIAKLIQHVGTDIQCYGKQSILENTTNFSIAEELNEISGFIFQDAKDSNHA